MLFSVLEYFKTNMSVINKLLCINHFKIPEVLQQEIKSYAFSDYETEAKKKMSKVATIINAFPKRNSHEKYWAFFPQVGNSLLPQMSGGNCRVCGGYISTSSTNFWMSIKDRVRCSCNDFLTLHKNSAALMGYEYNPDNQNYVYNPVYDQSMNGDMNFDQDEETELDQELDNWLYSEAGPHGPNGYDNDSDY